MHVVFASKLVYSVNMLYMELCYTVMACGLVGRLVCSVNVHMELSNTGSLDR